MKSFSIAAIFVSGLLNISTEGNPEDAVIWYDGGSSKALEQKAENVTVYFPGWKTTVNHYLKRQGYSVALQLDHSMDPVPDDVTLPDLMDLSALSDDALVDEYFSFLESHARAKGLGRLILPDTAHATPLERDVLKRAANHAGGYFVAGEQVSRELPRSRKEFKSKKSTIWIADDHNNPKKLIKWSRKLSDRLNRVFAEVMVEEHFPHEHAMKLPDSLSEKLFQNSVAAIDPCLKLPLSSRELVYIGNDRELRQMLSRYAQVYDQPQGCGLTTIVDQRHQTIVRGGDKAIIIDHLDASIEEDQTAILLPRNINPDATVIAGMLFGARELRGRHLSVDNRTIIRKGTVGHATPAWLGMNERVLVKADSLIQIAIRDMAMPGCQLSVIRDGALVWEKSYGYFTYDSIRPVTGNTVYDIASITKVAATVPAVMFLLDRKKLSLEDSVGKFLPAFSGTDKGSTTIRELLAHQGGLRAYLPLWKMVEESLQVDTLSQDSVIAPLFHPDSMAFSRDSLQSWVANSPPARDIEKYQYSDLGFIMLYWIVEAVSEQSFDQFLTQNFYAPMKLDIRFNPLKQGYDPSRIAPTEFDERYRNWQVKGEVHDRNAYVFGGVSGHAGLFSDATSLARLMNLFLEDGYYAGKKYLEKETLELFNHRHFEDNRRGLGWDKMDGDRDIASALASDRSFGHSGFTGTMVWADPETKMVFVFLSNRIYPSASNTKLNSMNLRTLLHDVFHESFLSVNDRDHFSGNFK